MPASHLPVVARASGANVRRRGSALLAVLWLSVALGVIAFSLAATIRGETERAGATFDGVRAGYLAEGAVRRGILYVLWGPYNALPDGTSRYYTRGIPRIHMEFPTGAAQVDIVPERAKLNVNSSPPEDLLRLLLAMGTPPLQAQAITEAIVDWRTPAPPGAAGPLDHYYLSLIPSFRARHASFEQIEELLLVRGMTPELFYGSYEADQQGRLIPRGGLRDCLSVYGSAGAVDVNTAHTAVLAAVGVHPVAITAIMNRRAAMPFRTMEEVAMSSGGAARLGIGGNSMYTVRAVARLRLQDGTLSETRRSVSALVKYLPPDHARPYDIIRWYENDWTPGPEVIEFPAEAPAATAIYEVGR
jgi:general secretion pathway protein K